MAVTINGSTTTNYWDFKLIVTETATSITNNTSSVKVDAYIGRYTVGSYMYGPDIDCTVKCTGVSNKSFNFSSSSQINIDAGEWYKIGSVTFTGVPHNSDGSKTVTVSASFTNSIKPSSGSASGSVKLTTIARASQPSCNTVYFGSAMTINTNRKSDSFTHIIRYKYGDLTGTIASNVGVSTKWTVPNSFMDLIPSATYGKGYIYADTYNGSTDTGTKIGTKYTGFTVNVPEGVKPSCTISTEDTTGVTSIYGNPVKGLSKIKITVTPTKAYSSPIASYSITANGTKYTTATATTKELLTSGNITISASVTDKRGRSGTASHTLNVLDYTFPKVSALSVRRCNADGTANDMGEYVQTTFSGTATDLKDSASVSKNTATYILKYKKTSETTYTEVALSALDNKFNVSNSTYIFAADSNSSYDVSITLKDGHGSNTRSTSASTAFTLMNFHQSGTAIGIGKVAEDINQFDVNIPSNFRKGILLQNGQPVNSPLSDGTNCNLIVRHSSNNIWIGSADAEGAIDQGDIYLATKLGRDAYVSRNNERHKVLDYSFVFQQLFSGSFSSGSITVSGMSKYHIYLIYFDGDNTPLIALRRGNVVRGIGGFSSGSNNPWINTIGLSISGDELTYGNATQFYINSSTKAIGSITTGKVVAAIYGILGTESNV